MDALIPRSKGYMSIISRVGVGVEFRRTFNHVE